MTNENNVDAQSGNGAIALKFTGQAGEYFRIWIVNICLSVVTLGIYSAWAKVRRKRYFYGNTLLNGAAFEYLANPKAILKGRIIVVAAFAAYSLREQLISSEIASALIGLLFILLFLGFLPRIVIMAARFNAINSAHRNVRFGFSAGYRETSQFLTLPVFLVPLTLGLLYPYYVFRKRHFILQHSAYGVTSFSFDARPGQFYFVYFKAALLFVVFLIGSVVTVGIGALPLYILFASYRDALLGRLIWKHTALGDLRFDCNWKTWDLFKLHLGNSLAFIFTLGLMAPWVAIRAARYQLQGLSLRPASAIGGFVAAAQQQAAATGDEAGELLGFDIGL